MIVISEELPSLDDLLSKMKTEETGAVVFFVGTVRGHSRDKKVEKLEFEAYREMGIEVLRDISKKAEEMCGVNKVFIHHRVGTLSVKDTILVIAVSASHREEAYEANRFILEEIKERLTVWKKEVYVEGESWIEGEG